jgi:FAD/FMN-containing dehydrogenase
MMDTLKMKTVTGGTVTVPLTDVARFVAAIRGRVLRAGDDEYESAREIWNAMIDKRPALIVRCSHTSDVVNTIKFARDYGLLLAIRSGGHNIAGSALCEGGVVIDLSQMKTATVDPANRRVTIEAGATLADLDAATQTHGLATPVGINSTTGIAGLTLGGGFGWLSRKYGMTIDNLESAEVVTASGEVVRASATEHPDLFWALRGGGGNFGVVTRFEFRLHPIGPNVLSGLIVYPLAEAKSVLQQYRDFMETAPDELSVWTVLRHAPPLPFLPEEVHGTQIMALALIYTGDHDEGLRLIEPLRHFGNPVGAHVGVQPYVAWQQAFDPLLTAGARNYWKSHNFSTLDDKLFDTVIEYVRTLPSPQGEIFIAALGGETMRHSPESAAYGNRDARFVMNVHGRWENAADDARNIAWARDFFKASAPFSTGGVYVNFMTVEESDRIKSAYGPNYERLLQVKRKYDPTNMFRVNQNIDPA